MKTSVLLAALALLASVPALVSGQDRGAREGVSAPVAPSAAPMPPLPALPASAVPAAGADLGGAAPSEAAALPAEDARSQAERASRAVPGGERDAAPESAGQAASGVMDGARPADQLSAVSAGAPLVVRKGEYEMIRSIAFELLKENPPDRYYYWFVGRSPAPIQAFFDELGAGYGSDLPASARGIAIPIDALSPKSLALIQAHVDRFRPAPEVLGKRKLLLVDHVDSGESLQYIRELLRAHGRLLGGVDSLALVSDGVTPRFLDQLRGQGHRILRYGAANVVSSMTQGKNFSDERYDDYAPHTSAPLGYPSALERVKANPRYAILRGEMGRWMADDPQVRALREFRRP